MNTNETTLSRLHQIGDGLKKYFDRYHPSKPYPFIAGGAIRDLYFGYFPKDYDVFLDTSVFSEDEREDACDLLSYGLPSAIGGDFADLICIPGKEKKYSLTKDNFQVYSFYGPEELGKETQLICKLVDKETIIKDFDYDLVRCWYDIDSRGITYSGEFLASARSKEIVSTSSQTTSRILNWFVRCKVGDFTIDKQYENLSGGDWKSDTFSKMYKGRSLNELLTQPNYALPVAELNWDAALQNRIDNIRE
jgi:hypothetical protein